MTTRNLIFDIPLGTEGLTSAIDPARLRPGMLRSCQNITLEDGTIRKEGGAASMLSSLQTLFIVDPATGYSVVDPDSGFFWKDAQSGPFDPICAGWDWWPNVFTQRIVIVTTAGSCLRTDDTDVFSVTLAAGLDVSSVTPVFVEGGQEAAALPRKLFLFTAKNAVQVLSGDNTAMTPIASPPADWSGTHQPRFGVLHEGRIWAGGNSNDPHRLYYTTTDNHEDYQSAGSGSLSIYPGEGEYLVGAVSFKGLLICFKYPVGIYIVDTTQPDLLNWKISRLSRAIGLAGSLAFAPIDDDVLFLDPNGNVNMISAVQEFGNLGTRNLTVAEDMINFMRANVNRSRLWDARMIYYTPKRRVEIGLSSFSSSVNDSRLVIDYTLPLRPRFLWGTYVGASALWLRKSSSASYTLASGDSEGFLWDLDQTDRSREGEPYTGTVRTVSMDFREVNLSLANKRKNGQFLEIVFDPKGGWDLHADIYWDDKLSQTITFQMGVAGAALGMFILGKDQLGSSGNVTNAKRRITGSGIRFGLGLRNSQANQDFSVARAYLHATVGDETMPGDR